MENVGPETRQSTHMICMDHLLIAGIKSDEKTPIMFMSFIKVKIPIAFMSFIKVKIPIVFMCFVKLSQ